MPRMWKDASVETGRKAMPKSKKRATEEAAGETAAFTFPCQFCGGETFTIREFGNFGITTAVCTSCQATERVSFLDV